MHVFSHGLSPLVVNEQRALHVAADVALILMIVATLRCVFALLLGRVGTAFAAFWMFGFAALFFGDYGPDAVRWGARAVDATGARGAMSLVVLIAVGVVSWRGAMRLARLVATLVARASFLLCRKLGPLLETVAQRQRARRAALASALAPPPLDPGPEPAPVLEEDGGVPLPRVGYRLAYLVAVEVVPGSWSAALAPYFAQGHLFGVEATASCIYGQSHAVPAWKCTCGFYATWRPEEALAQGTPADLDASRVVLCQVEGRGRVVEHEGGFRAAYQRVLRVAFSDRCQRCGEPTERIVVNVGSRGFEPMCSQCASGGVTIRSWTMAELTGVVGTDVGLFTQSQPEREPGPDAADDTVAEVGERWLAMRRTAWGVVMWGRWVLGTLGAGVAAWWATTSLRVVELGHGHLAAVPVFGVALPALAVMAWLPWRGWWMRLAWATAVGVGVAAALAG